MKRYAVFAYIWNVTVIAGVLASGGCGTTRWSDTTRTATEQMLVSDALERAVSEVDFRALANQDVYLDGRFVAGSVDEKYLIATLRQHMIASGCVLQDYPDDARYIVEIRAGGIGTNRHDLLFGMPSTHLPSGGPFPTAPASIPEVPLVKRTAQQGVCKIGVYAYDRITGHPVWQSGTRQVVSNIKDVWVFGAGPFQKGTIFEGTKFAGDRVKVPLAESAKAAAASNRALVAQEIRFPEMADDPAQPPRRKYHPQNTNASATNADPNSIVSSGGSPASAQSSSVPSSSGSGPLGSSPSGSGAPGSTPGSTAAEAPNAAAGTIGLLQAVDWFHAVRERSVATKPLESSTQTTP